MPAPVQYFLGGGTLFTPRPINNTKTDRNAESNFKNMENTEAKKSAIELPPPPYLPVSSMGRKSWTLAITGLLLLALIVVGVTLIGVYMTQKHTEAVVEKAFKTDSGEKVQQTVMVNEQDNIVACYSNINNVSSTILYDYRREIIGFRKMSEGDCYVMKMKDFDVPTMANVINSITPSQDKNSGRTEFIYNFLKGEKVADRAKLGVPVNLLCGSQPVYWGLPEDAPRKRGIWDDLFGKLKDGVKEGVKDGVSKVITGVASLFLGPQ